jgi:hypothetical protein
VRFVRVVDVVGSINPFHATYDSLGNIVNDPWPTASSSSGFDLDAVGVLNVVPEPSTAMLTVLTAFVLLYRCRFTSQPRRQAVPLTKAQWPVEQTATPRVMIEI